MSRQLIIHIGAPKCGSTFLQTLLRNNASYLVENNWLLPGLDQTHPGTSLSVLENYKDVLEDTIVNKKSAIISHEGLFKSGRKAKAMLEYASSHFDAVLIIAFVRPVEDLVFARYSQQLKTNYQDHWIDSGKNLMGFEEFVEYQKKKPGMDVALKRWSKLIEGVDTQVHQHTTITDVLGSILELNLDDQVLPAKTNRSFRVCDCEETVKRLQNEKMSWEEAMEIWKRNARSVDRPDEGKTKRRKLEIRNAMRGTIVRMNQNFSVNV